MAPRAPYLVLKFGAGNVLGKDSRLVCSQRRRDGPLESRAVGTCGCVSAECRTQRPVGKPGHRKTSQTHRDTGRILKQSLGPRGQGPGQAVGVPPRPCSAGSAAASHSGPQLRLLPSEDTCPLGYHPSPASGPSQPTIRNSGGHHAKACACE